MKQYLTNTIIKQKNEYIDSLFYIKNGIILEEKTNKIYVEGEYLFLDSIYSKKFSSSNYIAKTKVVGEWIFFKNLDCSINKILSSQLYKLMKYNELLLIKDPYIKLARFIYYEYESKELFSFYIPAYKELSVYLNLDLKDISKVMNFLINKNIITKHNKLITILNIKSLEDKAFLLDYK